MPAPIANETSHQADLETSVETPKNVVPFRPISDPKSPALTPVENSAFNELARQLSARLKRERHAPQQRRHPTPRRNVVEHRRDYPSVAAEPRQRQRLNGWRLPAAARGETRRDKALLDLMPVGVLIYRLDRLLYANPAFLARMGYRACTRWKRPAASMRSMSNLASRASSTSDTGTPVTISRDQCRPRTVRHRPKRTCSRFHGTTNRACADFFGRRREARAGRRRRRDRRARSADRRPSPVGHANAEELAAILDTTAEGIVMFDAEGNINSCNRSAEALFGYGGADLMQRNLADLFAPESQRVVLDYLESVKGADIASLLDHGRDVLGRVRDGGLIPLSMTMGRTRPDGPNFFAVFRDLSQSQEERERVAQARRLADRAANAKADMLARISHEVRTPLNAIIGFADVMIEERFGALGNERYVEYMKDIRASGERVIAIINDLLDLSRIETGKLDLAFANQNLNDMVERCVAVMQPQANRERIIIRTSLAHTLPPVIADARALRQITLNLIGNSIHLANAGGQVIVSTALSDFGEVVLRVRDTGHGLNDNEVAAAMEPFRSQAPSERPPTAPASACR